MPGSYSVTPLLSWLRAILDLKLYYRAKVIKTKQNKTKQNKTKQKTTWYWYRDWQMDQWTRTEEPERKPHIYGYLIFDKEAKYICIYIYTRWNKERIFNKLWGSNLQSVCWKIKINPYLSPCTKLSFKLNTIINIKYDTLNLIEDKLIDTEREMS